MARARNHYITVTQGMSGHFAVMRAEYKEDTEEEWYWENTQTGIGRYKTRAEAKEEAIDWARSEEIPYKD